MVRETNRIRGNRGRNKILEEEKEEKRKEIKKRGKCRREKEKKGIKRA
jgi:hypothetical protein